MRKKITRQREQPVIEVMKPVPLHAWYAVPKENSKTGATKLFEQRQQCLKKFWVGQKSSLRKNPNEIFGEPNT